MLKFSSAGICRNFYVCLVSLNCVYLRCYYCWHRNGLVFRIVDADVKFRSLLYLTTHPFYDACFGVGFIGILMFLSNVQCLPWIDLQEYWF